jgi:DNA adenine methylase
MKSTQTTIGSVEVDAPSIPLATPFIKWVGGKTQLLPELRQRIPKHIRTYVEPFVGGGALFFNMQPAKAILCDSNPKLIILYVSVRDHKEELVDRLSEYETRYNTLNTLDAQQDFYYKKRTEFNARSFETDLTVDDAAQFIFLNKTNFNGLYRENAAGKYNAAFGWKERIRLFDDANLSSCSAALQNASITNGDFEDACDGLSAGDFVYFDPPYHSTFNGYQAGGFSVEDHLRLHNLFQRLTESGVSCMLSNSNTDFIKNLYADYNIEVVQAKRTINRNGSGRQGEELIITNYKSNQILQP